MSWVMVAAAGAGLLKSQMVDKPREERQRKLKATETALSGYTGRDSNQEIKEADPWGSMMSYGVSGGKLRQDMDRANLENKLLKAKADRGGWDTDLVLNNQGMGAQSYFNDESPMASSPWSILGRQR